MPDDCSKYIGRLRDICEGKANLPLDKLNGYRKIMGLPPFLQQDLPTQRTIIPLRKTSVSTKSQPKGLGDLVESALSTIGITEKRVSKWLGRPCGCGARKQKLNQLGQWAQRLISGNKTDIAKKELDSILEGKNVSSLQWAYGVTTVQQRRNTLLPKTLASLAKAGFDQPRLFIDGADSQLPWEKFNLPITIHKDRIKGYGNWLLGILELYIRYPEYDRYAIFQDDLVAYPDLRQYLDQSPYPENGYLNLFTFRDNERLVVNKHGWVKSNQNGYGAVALVFSYEALMALFSATHTFRRVLEATGPSKEPKSRRGWELIDGGVVTSMKESGWYEYIHAPSLVQHIGRATTMFTNGLNVAKTFRGESFSALQLGLSNDE